MDQGTDAIRKDIDATRDSMTAKMEQIEAKVRHTVDDVETKVRTTVDDVKSTVDSKVETVKQNADLRYQMDERPLVMVGGAVAAGFLLGMITGGGHEDDHRPQSYRPSGSYRATESFRDHETDHPFSRGAQSRGFGAGVLDQFSDEIETFKVAALNTLGMLARDWMKQNLPQLGEEFERARRQREREHRADAAGRPATERETIRAGQGAPATGYDTTAWRPTEPTGDGGRAPTP